MSSWRYVPLMCPLDDDDEPDLFKSPRDITKNYHGGDPFSQEAAVRTERSKANDIARIKAWMILRGRRGATSYECRLALGMSHQTCSARFTDLKTKEWGCFLIPLLTSKGVQVRRLTDTGSPAGVWIARGEL